MIAGSDKDMNSLGLAGASSYMLIASPGSVIPVPHTIYAVARINERGFRLGSLVRDCTGGRLWM